MPECRGAPAVIAEGARIEREAVLAARCAMREGAMKTRDAATALIVGDCACRQLCRLPPTIKNLFSISVTKRDEKEKSRG
jgi:hypothetical protein